MFHLCCGASNKTARGLAFSRRIRLTGRGGSARGRGRKLKDTSPAPQPETAECTIEPIEKYRRPLKTCFKIKNLHWVHRNSVIGTSPWLVHYSHWQLNVLQVCGISMLKQHFSCWRNMCLQVFGQGIIVDSVPEHFPPLFGGLSTL